MKTALTNVSVKPGWKVNGTRLFEAVQRKICGSNETSEVILLFDFWFQIYQMSVDRWVEVKRSEKFL